MSQELGEQLAAYQTAMTHRWVTYGPTDVHTQVSSLNHNQLVALVMANIGAQATAV